MVSSAKRAWLIGWNTDLKESPGRCPSSRILLNILLRESTTSIYRKGERGNPCWIPLLALKKSVGLPLIKGAIQGEFMHAWICLIKMGGKPNFSKTKRMKSYVLKGIG